MVRGSVRAVHKATGRPVRSYGITAYLIENGLIRDYWLAYDRQDHRDRQLGGWRP